MDGFTPHIVFSELERKFKPGEFIFVAYMGDISFADNQDISAILSIIRLYPETSFLLQTKDPACFNRWRLTIPNNVYLGTTIETNRNYAKSKAPSPSARFLDLRDYPHPHKFLSIEPIMDFDLPTLVGWMEILQPEIIEVGADNYHNNLPEPSPEKLEHLIRYLRDICPTVIEKDGLERLKERR